MRILKYITVLAGLFTCSGCLARQVATDGRGLRQALVELYTEQAMDNLIRAHEGQPFVQLSYNSLSVQDTDSVVLAASGGSATFGASNTTDVSKTAPLNYLRGISSMGKFPFGINAERDRQLSFHADPVTNQNWVYEAYLVFAKNPSKFATSSSRPDCPVHICRKQAKKWYWVPTEAGGDFLDLVLTTATSSSAVDTTQPMGYWETTIKKVSPVPPRGTSAPTPSEPQPPANTGPSELGAPPATAVRVSTDLLQTNWQEEAVINGDSEIPPSPDASVDSAVVDSSVLKHSFEYQFELSDAVPYDRGSVQVIMSNGCKEWLPVIYDQATALSKSPDEAQMTLVVRSPKSIDFRVLQGAKLRFFTESHPNLKLRTAAGPQVQDALESIRLQLTKIGNNGP